MTICIFPGTFNPIHNAHIKMAEFALEKYNFDKIIFIPSYLPPHKEINKNQLEFINLFNEMDVSKVDKKDYKNVFPNKLKDNNIFVVP